MPNHEEILDFITQFRDLGAENCFSYGMCYYFNVILQHRFGPFTSTMYDEVENHFGTKIGDRIYDITGDVSEKYNWIYWNFLVLNEPNLYQRIKRDCIDKRRD